jgi:Uma2 family endonuclease
MPPPPTTPTERPGFTFAQIAADPRFRDLPYQIETNARGQIIMSPTPLRHGAFQSQISILLARRLAGRVVTESAVRTADGEKIADVAWFSDARWGRVEGELSASIAPEICIEIRSPSNTDAEMEAKRALYFDAGAEEVWVCDEDGAITFYDADGQVDASHRAPAFPAHVEL